MHVIEDLEMSYLGVWGGIYMPSKVSLEERGRGRSDARSEGRQVGTKAETGVMGPMSGRLEEPRTGSSPSVFRVTAAFLPPDSGSVTLTLDFRPPE